MPVATNAPVREQRLSRSRRASPSRSSSVSAITLAAVEHVVDADIFVGLVREIEDARAVGDAVLQPADAVDVLLVVGAGRHHIFGRQPEHFVRWRSATDRTIGASFSVMVGGIVQRSRDLVARSRRASRFSPSSRSMTSCRTATGLSSIR